MLVDSLNPRQLFFVRQATQTYLKGVWVSAYQGQLAMDICEGYSACISYPEREDVFIQLKLDIEIWECRMRTGGF